MAEIENSRHPPEAYGVDKRVSPSETSESTARCPEVGTADAAIIPGVPASFLLDLAKGRK